MHSVRTPEALLYADELAQLAKAGALEVTPVFTRTAPADWDGRIGRLDADLLDRVAFPPADRPTSYVCGPTGFVETVADVLVTAGHDPARVRTERFGPSGGSR